MKTKKKLIRYYKNGWRIGFFKSIGPKWISIITIKGGNKRGAFKIRVTDKHNIIYQ